MRHGRAKAARRTLKFYEINAGFRPPYRILLDGNFLVAAARQKLIVLTTANGIKNDDTLQQRISKLLQGETFELYVCRAALTELAKLTSTNELDTNISNLDAFAIARRWGLDECHVLEEHEYQAAGNDTMHPNLEKNKAENNKDFDETNDPDKKRRKVSRKDSDKVQFVEAQKAILSLVKGTGVTNKLDNPSGHVKNNKHRKKLNKDDINNGSNNPRQLFVATQDEILANELRQNIPFVPIIRLSQSVLLLEAPSALSRHTMNKVESTKQSAKTIMTSEEQDIVDKVKSHKRKLEEQSRKETRSMNPKPRIKQKAKGPNPLSCKKKKVKTDGAAVTITHSNDETQQPKRKRSRRR